MWRRRARTPVTIVRPPVVYGPRDWGLRDMYWTVARGLRPEIGGPKRISIVHVRDLAEGIVQAALSEAGADQIFYLSNPDPVGISDVLDVMQRSLGVRALRVGIPDRVVRLLGAVAEDGARWAGLRSMFGRDKALEMTQKAWVCSPAKAQRLLGWRASIPLEEGMKETARWYLEHGYI